MTMSPEEIYPALHIEIRQARPRDGALCLWFNPYPDAQGWRLTDNYSSLAEPVAEWMAHALCRWSALAYLNGKGAEPRINGDEIQLRLFGNETHPWTGCGLDGNLAAACRAVAGTGATP